MLVFLFRWSTQSIPAIEPTYCAVTSHEPNLGQSVFEADTLGGTRVFDVRIEVPLGPLSNLRDDQPPETLGTQYLVTKDEQAARGRD